MDFQEIYNVEKAIRGSVNRAKARRTARKTNKRRRKRGPRGPYKKRTKKNRPRGSKRVHVEKPGQPKNALRPTTAPLT